MCDNREDLNIGNPISFIPTIFWMFYSPPTVLLTAARNHKGYFLALDHEADHIFLAPLLLLFFVIVFTEGWILQNFHFPRVGFEIL